MIYILFQPFNQLNCVIILTYWGEGVAVFSSSRGGSKENSNNTERALLFYICESEIYGSAPICNPITFIQSLRGNGSHSATVLVLIKLAPKWQEFSHLLDFSLSLCQVEKQLNNM